MTQTETTTTSSSSGVELAATSTHDQVREPELIVRTFAADLTPGDGRTVDCRIVPYGEQIEHNDGLGGLPVGVAYREEWVPGCFQAQERAAHRVVANVEHEEGIAGIVGHGLALREGPDGLYGSFTLHDDPVGNKALLLIKEGVLDQVSLEAKPLKTFRNPGTGLVRRMKAHLRAIAFTRFGAYAGATVLAVREQAHTIEETGPELEPIPDLDAATVERCQRLGITLPERYQAHPDDTDTPSEEGTSESGTRQPDTATTEDTP